MCIVLPIAGWVGNTFDSHSSSTKFMPHALPCSSISLKFQYLPLLSPSHLSLPTQSINQSTINLPPTSYLTSPTPKSSHPNNREPHGIYIVKFTITKIHLTLLVLESNSHILPSASHNLLQPIHNISNNRCLLNPAPRRGRGKGRGKAAYKSKSNDIHDFLRW